MESMNKNPIKTKKVFSSIGVKDFADSLPSTQKVVMPANIAQYNNYSGKEVEEENKVQSNFFSPVLRSMGNSWRHLMDKN